MRRALGLTVALVLAAYAVVACAPSTASSPSPASPAAADASAAKAQAVTASDLARWLGQKDFTLVNVHTPYQGEIEGTDVFIPYDQIEANLARLPSDRGAKIVLYCRSGSMSAIAARTLVGLGYTNVSDLQGGMGAWTAAGYQVVERPQ